MQRSAQASILLHQVAKKGVHLDLLLAHGKRCLTWSLVARPWALGQARNVALFDWQLQFPHRRFYLDYSGPVSGDRGRVRCLWRGPVSYKRQAAGHQIQASEFAISLAADGLASFEQLYRLQPWLKSNWVVLMTQQQQRK